MYTCIFGQYDELHDQPITSESKATFVCFTDRDDLQSGTWQIRKVRTAGLDSSRESRRPKLLPHLFLADFEHSIYIDGTVKLILPPEEILSRWMPAAGPEMVCFKHPERHCTYEEAEAVILLGIDDEKRVREQMDFYRRHGFPGKAGLIAATFIMRRHNAATLSMFSEDWYAHVLRFSKRDQLSFQYNARRHRLSYRSLDLDLRVNPIMEWQAWPHRIPYDFDSDTYFWLNPDVARSGMDAATHYIRFGRREGRSIRYHPRIELDVLANKYKTDKGSLYYNRHQYARIYELHLQEFKNSVFTLFEIGLLRPDIQAGTPEGPFADAPSLKMWRDFFPRAEIHGFDIKDFSPVAGDRIKFTQGDSSSTDDLIRAMKRCKAPLKVIIDDASHASHHQQKALTTLFPYLEPGGYYFIEDLQYQPLHLEQAGAVKTFDFLKALESGRPTCSSVMDGGEVETLRNAISSIRFYDSMDYHALVTGIPSLAVIRKRQQ